MSASPLLGIRFMCTIALLPGPDGHLLLAGNRDEHRLRPRALPPTARREDDKAHLAIYPIDASAGGTWVGANAPGVVATLLNNYQASSVFDTGDATPRSRGLLIPELLARCENLDEVEAWLQGDLAEHLARTFPFLLVVASRHAPHEALRVDWRGHGALRRLVAPGLGETTVTQNVSKYPSRKRMRTSRSPFCHQVGWALVARTHRT